jgi:hypothetical protein
MKRSIHQLVSEKDLKGYINFTPEFTKSEKNTLKRFGYAPLPGSPYLHSSKGQWIEKVEKVEYIMEHKDTKLTGITETNRVLTYSLIRRHAGVYSDTLLIEDTDFKSFTQKMKTMYELDNEK